MREHQDVKSGFFDSSFKFFLKIFNNIRGLEWSELIVNKSTCDKRVWNWYQKFLKPVKAPKAFDATEKVPTLYNNLKSS